jgi:hypothetical protein
MDEFLVTVYMVLGILLRIGIPFVITFLLAWFLRSLDTKWRVEALQAQPCEALLHQVWLSEPCWEEINCLEELREVCSAFLQTEKPCWAVFQENGNLQPKCLDCEYRKELLIPAGTIPESARHDPP